VRAEMATSDGSGPGPLPALIGGVIGAFVLLWVVGVVVGTIVFFVRVVVFLALAIGVLWVWGKLSRS
jgi:hypothetical protein